MELVATLNLAWLVLGLGALLGVALWAARRPWKANNRHRLSLLVGVTIILAALFPYISASDDSLRFSHYASHHKQQQHHETNKADADCTLILLYEAASSAIPTTVFRLLITWLFLSVAIVCLPSWMRVADCWITGRAPPSALKAA